MTPHHWPDRLAILIRWRLTNVNVGYDARMRGEVLCANDPTEFKAGWAEADYEIRGDESVEF